MQCAAHRRVALMLVLASKVLADSVTSVYMVLGWSSSCTPERLYIHQMMELSQIREAGAAEQMQRRRRAPTWQSIVRRRHGDDTATKACCDIWPFWKVHYAGLLLVCSDSCSQKASIMGDVTI